MFLKVAPLSWIVVSVLCSSLAHLLLKIAAMRLGGGGTWFDLVQRAATNGWLVGGVALHAVALVFWILGLQRVQLSVAYPFIAAGIALVALFAWLFLGEHLSPWRVAGMLLIVTGVCVIART